MSLKFFIKIVVVLAFFGELFLISMSLHQLYKKYDVKSNGDIVSVSVIDKSNQNMNEISVLIHDTNGLNTIYGSVYQDYYNQLKVGDDVKVNYLEKYGDTIYFQNGDNSIPKIISSLVYLAFIILINAFAIRRVFYSNS